MRKILYFQPSASTLLSCWEILPCPGDAQVPRLDRQHQGVAYKLGLRAPDETCVRCGPVPRKGSSTAGAVPSPGELLLLCAPARSLLGQERRSCSKSTGTHCCAAVRRSQVGAQVRWLEEGSSAGLQVVFAGVGSCPVRAENFPLTALSSGADPGAC